MKKDECILLFGSWGTADGLFKESTQDRRVFSVRGISPCIDTVCMRRPLIAVDDDRPTKRILFQIKGMKKLDGGRCYREYSPSIMKTDYKEPSLIIEYEE